MSPVAPSHPNHFLFLLQKIKMPNTITKPHFYGKQDIVNRARSLTKGTEEWVRGRLIGTNKMSVEILDTDGVYRYIARDVIVEVRLIAHMRPAYIDDDELLQFEREDQKRRTKIHEDVEKKTKGGDDDHLWG